MAQNNTPDLAALLGNRQAIEQIAASADAKALASMLAKDLDQQALETMAKNAMGGDTAAIRSLFQSITSNPESADLLRKLSSSLTGH